MKITKYGQSAILIEEYKGKRILIDPGTYMFDQINPEDLGKIDIILITHTHSDHCVPEKIQTIIDNNPAIFVLSNEEVDKIVEKVPAGSNNLIYTPWLIGERSPVDDATIRGGLYNLSFALDSVSNSVISNI